MPVTKNDKRKAIANIGKKGTQGAGAGAFGGEGMACGDLLLGMEEFDVGRLAERLKDREALGLARLRVRERQGEFQT